MKILWKFVALLLLPQLVAGQFNYASIGNNAGTFDFVRFAFQYILPSGASVNQNNLESLLCRTQDYFTDEFRKHNDDPTLTFETVSIKWDPPREDYPVNVSFTALVATNGSDALDKKDIVKTAGQLDMKTYLAERVVAVGCEEDDFAQASGASFKASPAPPQAGDFNLTLASCQHTCAPTVSPGIPTSKPAERTKGSFFLTNGICFLTLHYICVSYSFLSLQCLQPRPPQPLLRRLPKEVIFSTTIIKKLR